jgi:hypothetical protein
MDNDETQAAVDGAELQDAICALTGVRAARVVTGIGGRISEIHVVAEEGKSAKQVVRDIQTLALARFGIQIDYRVVSVVQLSRDPVTHAPVASRPVLSSVSWHVEGARTTCRVDVSLGDQRASGEANGPATAHGRLRLAAKAASDALSVVDGGDAALDVADVILTEAGGRRIAVVVLVLLSGRNEEVLAGAAVVRADDADAVVRAVLDAANRRLTHAR